MAKAQKPRVTARTSIPALALGLVLAGLCSNTSAAAQCPKIAKIKNDSVIVSWGDSLTLGTTSKRSELDPQGNTKEIWSVSKNPWPKHVAILLGHGLTVTNQGVGGETAEMALQRLDAPVTSSPAQTTTPNEQSPTRRPDLITIMYGTNDFFGWLRANQNREFLDRYRRNLTDLVERGKSRASAVLLLTPPPLKNPEVDRLLDTYRSVVAEVGASEGVPVLDTKPLLAGRQNIWADGVHFTDEGYRLLAEGIACRLTVE